MDRLERAVQERTAALAREVGERRRAEQVQHALYQIADLSASALDTRGADRQPAPHHRRADGGEELPDRADPSGKRRDQHSVLRRREGPRGAQQAFPLGIGMCSYVLKTKQAQLHDAGSFARLVASGKVQ
jgi:hypothetical protein